MGVVATTAMYWIRAGDWKLALMLFILGNIAVAASIVFYESLLPHLVSESELDRVSSAGYAIGYLGGGVLLAINLLMIQRPAWFGIPMPARPSGSRSRASASGGWCSRFPSSARCPSRVRRIETGESPAGSLVGTGVRRLIETFHELRRYKQAFLLLVAFLIYNDGIQTIIRMATTFGSQIGIDQNAMITALLITQFIGVPFAFLFGMVAGRDRREDGGLRRPRGLRRHHHARVLHDDAPRTSTRSRSWSAWCRAGRRRSAGRSSPA